MSNEKKTSLTATARAIVTVEIVGLGTWGDDCSMDQVYRQAEAAARGRVEQAFNRTVKIQNVQVTAILTERT